MILTYCWDFQWCCSDVVKTVLQRWSYEYEVPSTICSVLYIVYVHVYKYTERKHFKLTENGSKPFISAKSLINFASEFQVET